MLLLHGRGADEYDLLGVADRLPLAFNYASVRAPVPVAGGGFTWFENHGAGRPVARSLESSIRSLRAWLDGPAIAPVSGRCYPFGFSAGMMMAGALLLDDPKRFSGAVLLSGALALRDAALCRRAGLSTYRSFTAAVCAMTLFQPNSSCKPMRTCITRAARF